MWRVEYTKRFLKDLASLPRGAQQQAEMIVFQELYSTNPFELGYLEKMAGYANKYKIRVGDYRIGITMDKQTQAIICQRIAHQGFSLNPRGLDKLITGWVERSETHQWTADG